MKLQILLWGLLALSGAASAAPCDADSRPAGQSYGDCMKASAAGVADRVGEWRERLYDQQGNAITGSVNPGYTVSVDSTCRLNSTGELVGNCERAACAFGGLEHLSASDPRCVSSCPDGSPPPCDPCLSGSCGGVDGGFAGSQILLKPGEELRGTFSTYVDPRETVSASITAAAGIDGEPLTEVENAVRQLSYAPWRLVDEGGAVAAMTAAVGAFGSGGDAGVGGLELGMKVIDGPAQVRGGETRSMNSGTLGASVTGTGTKDGYGYLTLEGWIRNQYPEVIAVMVAETSRLEHRVPECQATPPPGAPEARYVVVASADLIPGSLSCKEVEECVKLLNGETTCSVVGYDVASGWQFTLHALGPDILISTYEGTLDGKTVAEH